MENERPIDRVVSEEEARRREMAQAIAELRDFRKGRGKITVEELLAMKDAVSDGESNRNNSA